MNGNNETDWVELVAILCLFGVPAMIVMAIILNDLFRK